MSTYSVRLNGEETAMLKRLVRDHGDRRGAVSAVFRKCLYALAEPPPVVMHYEGKTVTLYAHRPLSGTFTQ